MNKKTATGIGAVILGLAAISGLALVFSAPKPANGEEWIRKKYSATVVYDEKPKPPPTPPNNQRGDTELPADQRRLRELFPELGKATTGGAKTSK